MRKKKKITPKEESVNELIKSNRYLMQYCNILNLQYDKNSLDLNKVIGHIQYLESKLMDTQKVVNLMLNSISPETMDKMRRDIYNNYFDSKNSSSIQNKKDNARIFHDNLTKVCPICHSVGLQQDETCKECGYKNSNKER